MVNVAQSYYCVCCATHVQHQATASGLCNAFKHINQLKHGSHPDTSQNFSNAPSTHAIKRCFGHARHLICAHGWHVGMPSLQLPENEAKCPLKMLSGSEHLVVRDLAHILAFCMWAVSAISCPCAHTLALSMVPPKAAACLRHSTLATVM